MTACRPTAFHLAFYIRRLTGIKYGRRPITQNATSNPVGFIIKGAQQQQQSAFNQNDRDKPITRTLTFSLSPHLCVY